MIFAATTDGIEVRVEPVYLADNSDPAEETWVWAYKVRIHNGGRETVQLLRRTWRITDGLGRVETVRGEGVVGEQPVLEPGDGFDYTSGTPLGTPTGFMEGTYHMIATGSGREFDVLIPAFSLDSPGASRRLH